jgi:hypothetical protein
MRSKFWIRDATHTDADREFQDPKYNFQWFTLALIVFSTIDFFLRNLG